MSFAERDADEAMRLAQDRLTEVFDNPISGTAAQVHATMAVAHHLDRVATALEVANASRSALNNVEKDEDNE